jgi:hypothetical protein
MRSRKIFKIKMHLEKIMSKISPSTFSSLHITFLSGILIIQTTQQYDVRVKLKVSIYLDNYLEAKCIVLRISYYGFRTKIL